MKDKYVTFEELGISNVLHKFRDFKEPYHIRSLLNQEIYVASLRDFNDPFEGRILFRYKNEELTEQNLRKKAYILARQSGYSEQEARNKADEALAIKNWKDEDFLEWFDKWNYDQYCNEFGVLCLTPKIDSIPMWAYYARSHQGFAIGYNMKVLLETESFGMGGPVEYVDQFPEMPILPEEGSSGLFFKALFHKHLSWTHEEEFRLLHICKRGRLLKFPKDSISEFTFGCMVPEKDRIKWVEQLSHELPNCKIYQMKMNTTNFGLVRQLILDPEAMLFV